MNLFGVLVCAFFVGEGWTARFHSSCPQIKIQFGRVRYRARGKIARFLCNTGYMLAGDKYSTCDSSGKWDSPSFPKCVRPTCKASKPLKNGLIFPSHRGAVLNFYCKSGFELRGVNITYCDGYNWDNPLPACLPTNSTTSLSCDFEQEDICGWNHDLNHDFDWKRLNYATPSGHIGTGPSYDHTKGVGQDGYYMYIESSARNINDTARLISPVYDRSDDTVCFEFYYHMYGTTIGSLRVYLKKVNDTWNLNPRSAVFIKNGNQGNKWYRGFIVLGPIDDEYQIVIEGVRGLSYVSDIAVDDVKIIRNCVPENEIDEGETTTEESLSSEPPISVESCENRCNTNDTHTYTYLLTCDCDEGCYERNRCCPDYFDFCLLGTSSDDLLEETTEFSTTEEETTTITTTSTTRKLTTPSKMTTLNISTRKYVTNSTIPVPTTQLPPNDKDDVDEIPYATTIKQDIPEVPKEVEIDDYDSDKTFDHQKIEVSSKMTESNMKTIVFGVGVVFGVLFAMVGMAFVARRYQLCQCRRMRLNQSSNGDSQSDVRFLTSDEVIDFTLATDYDTL